MEALFAIADRQLGLFTRTQAAECGVDARALRYRVGTGVFEAVSRNVLRVKGSEASWRQSVLAACLAGGSKCVASHRTAALLHGFDGIRGQRVEVTVPRGTRVRGIDAIIHESLDLCDADRTLVGPIPTTTPARTLIDLGAVTWWERVEEAMDGAVRDRSTRTDLVAARHAAVRRRGRRGVGPMAVVLDGRIEGAHSVLERMFLRLLEDAHLPQPATQYRIDLPSGKVAYIDAAYPELRLGFELDGHGAHATRRQRAADNRRAAAITDLGWTLRRFTYEQVSAEGASVIATVRAAIGSCDARRQ